MRLLIAITITLSLIFGAFAFHGSSLDKGTIEKEILIKMHDLD